MIVVIGSPAEKYQVIDEIYQIGRPVQGYIKYISINKPTNPILNFVKLSVFINFHITLKIHLHLFCTFN